MKKYISSIFMMTAIASAMAADDKVSLKVNGLAATLDNGIVKFDFAADASAKAVIKNGVNLVENLAGAARDPSRVRSFYLDYHSRGVTHFNPEVLNIIEDTGERAHIAWTEKNGKIYLEYHLVMNKGESGLYSYVIARNTTDKEVLVSELRTIYRFNAALMNNLYTANGISTPPLYGDVEKMPVIQDETWKLPDGKIYSKYDLVDYQRRNEFWGALGGGYGAWFIPVNHDYFSGGPLKQDLMVHQDAIILNYMTGAHMGTPDLMAPPKWEKMYGPWQLYINQGKDAEVISDAAKQAQKLKPQWPFKWVNEKLYPQQRADISGKVTGRSGEILNVVISPVRGDPELQTKGYIYHARTDANGQFSIPAVRPGTYALTIYTQSGIEQGNILQSELVVEAGKKDLGNIALPAKANYQWSIGVADRTAAEYQFADKPRNYEWQTKVPESLDFKIGINKNSDWFYAQTKFGDWNIHFDEKDIKSSRRLNLAFASASNSGMTKPSAPRMIVLVNGKQVSDINYPNDKTIYRGALTNGLYHNESIEVPAELLKAGANVITLRNQGGAFMYDSINWEIVK